MSKEELAGEGAKAAMRDEVAYWSKWLGVVEGIFRILLI